MKEYKISIVGLGYVGLPLAILFSKKHKVLGYDINKERINQLKKFNDITLEVSKKALSDSVGDNLVLTHEKNDLCDSNIYIITVPTPVDINKKPNLKFLFEATRTVGLNLNSGDIVIYESTVYPGCTEQECVPILEKISNLKFNKDFYCGYSPERVNPGDKVHTIDKIIKVVAGSNSLVTKRIAKLYSSIIPAGVYIAQSIKVAEAAKVIENSQRDINIAFVNELAKIFGLMNIDTNDVLDAASTKWNFLNFRPGLVGGHCIGVDPYYLASKAEDLGYKPEVILSGRKVNDGIGAYISDTIIKNYNQEVKTTNVLILGATFKENCPDYRNSKVLDIYKSLSNRVTRIDIYDPWINTADFKRDFDINILEKINSKYDIIILAVAHKIFKKINLNSLKKTNSSLIYDVKGFFDKDKVSIRL
ncbi:MAG: nucleotide sugar dehydrogenase [Cytophagales bacterium]